MTSESNNRLTLIRHNHPEEFVQSIAVWVAEELRRAITAKGRATLVVSSGRTPAPIFAALSQQRLPWRHMQVLLADERWVPHDHEASNARLVREHLITGPAAAASFLPFSYSDAGIEADADAMDKYLAEHIEPFDVLLLGVGDDGHTASLFPCAAELDAGLAGRPQANCLAVMPTQAPHARLSMTLPRLLNSEKIALLLRGQNKLDVYQRALEQPDIHVMPVRGILLQNRVPVFVHWCP